MGDIYKGVFVCCAGEEQQDGNKGSSRLVFTGFDVPEGGEMHGSPLISCTTPSRDLDLGLESMELFPELNVMMNR